MKTEKTLGQRNAYWNYLKEREISTKLDKSGDNNSRTRNSNNKSVKYAKTNSMKSKNGGKNSTQKKSIQKKKSNKSGMTYSQKKRAAFNYRSAYFKKNPGIYGSIWFCSQCGKMLVGKKNVVIDHIVPLNNVAGVNRTFNTVAICQKCNSSKSDKVDYRVVKGYLAKVFEVITMHLPDALALILSLLVSLAYQIFNLLFIIVTIPFTAINGNILTYIVVIFIFIILLYNKSL